MGEILKLEDIDTGNVLSYQGAEWTVSEKRVCEQSGSYLEVQWTLQGSPGGEAYLLETEEKGDAGATVAWVFTRQTLLESILFEKTPGQWANFKELDMPASAPASVKFVNQYFSFEGETSVQAEDDEGDMVPKLTWDYFSADRKRNLAIEIWKEPDRDYPEAYDGIVVDPSTFTILGKKARVFAGAAFVSGDEAKAGFGAVGIIGFIGITNGLPVDYFFSFGPAAGVLALMMLRRPPRHVIIFSAVVWAAVAALVWFNGFGLSFWYLTAVCSGLCLVLTRLLAALVTGREPGRYYQVALFGAFPALWVYSFLEYLVYAPGPRAFYQFAAAFILPLAATGLCVLAGFLSDSAGRESAGT
ncbi:MAG: hypothetical protein A2234_04935 [Elusimicrobia bacterium RIFOXYA2_FULL_58_8]|nr:MAG: hypothetical protein A2285_01030 [Elusimicrobia bacterium RIFOXYA12_FULL_57_11]OGS16575.1 MAG: hypothetical protein A2234_04935 [Elusimicrobia bacterium RIFOXYA2_FULL_58_8]